MPGDMPDLKALLAIVATGQPLTEEQSRRAFDVMDRAFHDRDLMIRSLGETLVLTPPLIISEAQIGEIFDKLAGLIRETA